jgi:hypothetical protein
MLRRGLPAADRGEGAAGGVVLPAADRGCPAAGRVAPPAANRGEVAADRVEVTDHYAAEAGEVVELPNQALQEQSPENFRLALNPYLSKALNE